MVKGKHIINLKFKMLYLVELDGAYKIGYSENIKSRMNSFKTSSFIVELLDTRDGEFKEERLLHEVLDTYNLRGELFRKDAEVIRIFKDFIFPEIQESEVDKEIQNLNEQIDKLIKENKMLKTELDKLHNIIKGKEEAFKEFKVSMEHPLTNKVEQFIFKLYKSNKLSFGNSLSYDITKDKFLNAYNTEAKIYNIKGNPHLYIDTGLALEKSKIISIINKIINSQDYKNYIEK